MSLSLLIKVLIGALIVVSIHFVAYTKNFYIAALVPLFPSFGLFSYYIVGRARGIGDLKTTVVFGMFSLIPYLAFLMTLYAGASEDLDSPAADNTAVEKSLKG